MIRYVDNNDIDRIKWDNCIDHSMNGIIYAYSWYLDIVCNGKWAALVEGDYKAVMPLPVNRKYGIDYIYHPFFAQQLGVFSTVNVNGEEMQNFLNAIPTQFKFVELSLNIYNPVMDSHVQIKRNLTHELSLNRPYEELYNSFSENIKRNIKKAEKAGLNLFSDISSNEIISLFRKNKGKDVVNIKNKDYLRLQHLVDACVRRNKTIIRGVKTNKGDLCAGVVFIQSHGKVIYFISTSAESGKSSGAMAYLVNGFINEYANKNMILDFEGSNESNLARFYKSFGSKERVYLFIKKNKLPKPIRWIKK